MTAGTRRIPDRCRRCGSPTPRRRFRNVCPDCGAPLVGDPTTSPPVRALLLAWLDAGALWGGAITVGTMAAGHDARSALLIASWCGVWVTVGAWMRWVWALVTLVAATMAAFGVGLMIVFGALRFDLGVAGITLALATAVPGAPSLAWGRRRAGSRDACRAAFRPPLNAGMQQAA